MRNLSKVSQMGRNKAGQRTRGFLTQALPSTTHQGHLLAFLVAFATSHQWPV